MKQVHIDSPNPTGSGSSITSEGQKIHGVRSAVVSLHYAKPTTAMLEVFGTFCGPARATFQMIDPGTGELKAVKRIDFEDGTAYEASEPAPTEKRFSLYCNPKDERCGTCGEPATRITGVFSGKEQVLFACNQHSGLPETPDAEPARRGLMHAFRQMASRLRCQDRGYRHNVALKLRAASSEAATEGETD